MTDLQLHQFPFGNQLDHLGGKAANLARLQTLGFQAPPFVVISHDFLQKLLPAHNDPHSALAFIKSFQFPENWKDTILEAFGPEPAAYFAVRSSGLAEDGTENSFAGQFKSELYVTPSGLLEAVRTVWLSAFEERVLSYAKEKQLTWRGEISIIIQEMIPAETAGVGFGLHPTEGWRDAVVISAVYGLGEGLVSGALDADTYVVRHGQIDKNIATKDEGFFYNPSAGKVTTKAISSDQQNIAALEDAQILELAQTIQQLNQALGRPQDIEFAYAQHQGRRQLFLLQTRPVTGLERLPDRSAHRIVWDNSNIIESYPGVTTPLTFSFIIKMYEAVYRQMGDIMGVPEQVLDKNREVFANMLGLLRGRVYYNLEGWYRALAMLPGYKVNARYMETMMGVKERFDVPEETTSAWQAWSRLIWSVLKMLGLLFRLSSDRKQFKQTLDAIIAEYRVLDFDNMPPDAAMRRYLHFEQFLLKKWKAPLVNDFFAMIYFGILKKTCTGIAPDNPSLHNDLLAGSHDIISTEPFRRILAIATSIHQHPETKVFFLQNTAEHVWQNLGRFPDIHRLVIQYLDDFGERTVGELKLETITYTQHPASFIAILQSYAKQPLPSRASFDETAVRREAESKVRQAYRLKPLKKWFFFGLLKRTRSLVSSRENLRYERTRGFGVVRRIFCGIGKQFAAEGILAAPRDIFYLTKEEIFDFIKGTAVQINLRELVSQRKAEYAVFEQEQPLPERITTFGTVYHGNDFRQVVQAPASDGPEDANLLKGLGCSAGIVRARVRVVRNPDELSSLEGDILVTSSTDPGWVALFPSASAILVERGSLLSHSAIVSRELGIPCVVGISGLLNRVKTGDLVEMNGTSGEVRVLDT